MNETNLKDIHDVMNLCSAELLESHRLLDVAGIAKTGFDEQLSISQRVERACGLIQRLKVQCIERY
jgi:hypothetical protein